MPPFREDGSVDLLGRFKQITFGGERVWAYYLIDDTS
jgi:hypothetical protein